MVRRICLSGAVLAPDSAAVARALKLAAQAGTAYVFTGNPRLARAIGLKPDEEVPLFNGKIPCRLLKFAVL